ncbi:unnamed protein product [Bursaphelenchus xylophilus]|uniref:(pine wood nematode) hypothetical protein n=1 Tax=Bursaphelenchus xylophilus TaxID=6326 RepID=A0A1I7RLF1_BURXY|nr:unnamed protein product [Bursaphelenchus xylophilus]CAG9083055.1 unnamed protein product [Bursaphelenchus xylophilus]
MFVAVLRLKPLASDLKCFRAPDHFEVLIQRDFLGNHLVPIQPGADYSLKLALRSVAMVDSTLAQRAVPVPMCLHGPSSSSSTPSHLVCVPVLDELHKFLESDKFKFYNLAELLNLSINEDKFLDRQTSFFITRIGEWLEQQQCSNVSFLADLFRKRASKERIRSCVHSPAYSQKFRTLCKKQLQIRRKDDSELRRCEDLEEDVEKANNTRALMILKEKYEKAVFNPVFGVLSETMKRTAPVYFVKGRSDKVESCQDTQISSSDSWEQMFPLHRAAFSGDHLLVKQLLDQGYDPNKADTDSWTPLHYSTFYNQFKACEVLMLHPETDVNARNKTGASPLHFAALNGHVYLVELMISHSKLNAGIRDQNGKTALDFCESVPKLEWQNISALLRNLTVLRPEKIEINLIGRNSLQIKCTPATVTAGQLRDSILKVEGLNAVMSDKVFALWICSERLSLQLKAEMKIRTHLEKWLEYLSKWGDVQDRANPSEKPRLYFKRDARTLLGDERDVACRSAEAVRLLYGEAERQFLNGLYPAKEKDTIKMAAIILRLLFGQQLGNNMDYSTLTACMPRHLIPVESDRSFSKLVSKLKEAHSQLTQKPTTVHQLQFDFLQLCWKLNVYGCTFFKAHMYRSKPPFETSPVYLGVNDWGVSVIGQQTLKQLEAVELHQCELVHENGRDYLELHRKKHEPLMFSTPQALLVAQLFKQLQTKVANARTKK